MPNEAGSPAQAEAQIAQLLSRITDLATSMKTVTETVEKLKAEGQESSISTKSVTDKYESIKAQIEQIQGTIRSRRDHLHFSGIEDCAPKFNLLRLCAAVRLNRSAPEKIAPFEMEVVKNARKALESSGSMEAMVRAGHVAWDDVSGGIWVPDQVLPDVIQPIYTQSALIALTPETGQTSVSVIDGLTGGTVKIPEFQGGMIAYWIGEEDDYVETVSKSGNIQFSPKKLGVLTRITQEMLNLASPAFDAFMRRDMIRAAAKKLDYTLMYGTGTANMPIGITMHPRIKKFLASTVATATKAAFDASPGNGAELTFDSLMEMKGAIEDDDVVPDTSETFVSHPRYFRRLRQQKIEYYSAQTSGNGYLLGMPFISNERLMSIIGKFVTSTQIPTTKTFNSVSKFTDVLYGNLGEYILGRWGGLQIVDDGGEGTGFIRDQMYIKMRMWCDAECRQPRAILHCPDAKART